MEFEAVPVNLSSGTHGRTEFLAINPAGRAPGAHRCRLHAHRFSGHLAVSGREIPRAQAAAAGNLRERAEAYRRTLFAVTELEQPVWRTARHSGLYVPEERMCARPNAPRRIAELLQDRRATRQ